jgi:hypothetical protein
MFLLGGLSKLAALMLVCTVSIQVYGKEGHTSYANTASEGFLVLMLCTHACYELGQLSAKNWNVVRHFSDPWNTLDVSALLLIFLWAVLCASGHNFSAARTVLSLSSIPLSLQLLQYISVVETIGLLVLMIQSMMVDVAIFIVVYFASIFGFGVCFYGLFYGSPSFDSSGATLLYLFQSTLGNFDFGALDGSTYYGIGTAVLVLFLVLTTVLLLNLLIAQMSSTYSRIKDKSKEEWSFIMVRSALSMAALLLTPFNYIFAGLLRARVRTTARKRAAVHAAPATQRSHHSSVPPALLGAREVPHLYRRHRGGLDIGVSSETEG